MKELSWNYYDALSPEVVDSILEICLNEKLVDGEVGQSDMSYLVDSKVLLSSSLLQLRQVKVEPSFDCCLHKKNQEVLY